ncbi:MAG: hypothetical protein E5W85_11030 [Mesorhizobium sp.]|nr:MAG: hypothetical protein EOQ41_02190 [Mesorhizobium sp.]RWD44128.1 MAG: hypothetical protein EOS35_18445 [Mesorhizobium sp.]TIT14467.1 MAG: hypothetical protein E5W85_11030 [Mesorhizobium sp.]
MSMSWTYADLKRKALGAIVAGSSLAVMVGLAQNKWANDASPVRSVETVDAMVRSVQWDRVAIYLVSIENGPSVLIKDKRPHLIGARATIERVTRDNGSIFYRFPE